MRLLRGQKITAGENLNPKERFVRTHNCAISIVFHTPVQAKHRCSLHHKPAVYLTDEQRCAGAAGI